MKCSSFYSVLVLIITLCTLLITSPLSAQSIWLDQDKNNSIAIEILKPKFDSYTEYTFVSSTIFLSGRHAVNENIILIVELPFAHCGYRYYDWWWWDTEISETIFGNPYLGVEVSGHESPVFGEFGLRLPLTPEDKFFSTTFGVFSDYNRFEAFIPNIVSLTAKGNYRYIYNKVVSYRLRLGPTLWINTNRYGNDTELLLDYSGQIEYKDEPVTFIIGISGRFIVSAPNLAFHAKDAHQIGIAGSVGIGSFRPGLFFQTPIDKKSYYLLSIVYGLNLSYQLP